MVCATSNLDLVHHDHAPKPYLATLHVLDGIFHLIKWKLFNHALDPLLLREINGLFAVKRMAAGPSVD
jgi:hypothetical protein